MSVRLRTVIVVFSVLICVSLLVAWRLNKGDDVRSYETDNLIRFHVVANSNSADDQALKYRVRDVVVKAMSTKFGQINDINEARKISGDNLSYIQRLAAQEVRAAGKDYPVAVSMGHYMFPAKTYHQNNLYDFILPAGEYEAVKVVLGQGSGANWWCVLFPPLCFVDPSSVVSPKENNSAEVKCYKTDTETVPAFKLGTPSAVTALGTLKRDEQSIGPAWTMTVTKGEAPVEFRFKILDYFHFIRI